MEFSFGIREIEGEIDQSKQRVKHEGTMWKREESMSVIRSYAESGCSCLWLLLV